MFGNLNDIVLDEIALEGLDGITVEGLWNRLSDRLKIPLPFTEKVKNRFWGIVKVLKPINMYEIPDPRPFFIFDRYSHVEPELGIVIDPDEIPLNIYPYYPVNDTFIQGSCKHFETRVDKTNEIRLLTVEEVETRYPNKIVIVASQEVRYNTLVGNNYQLTLTPIQYCILERIGRSRYLGEVTIGKVSLQDIGESAKSLFYHRKTLLKYQLITKQPYQQKLGVANNSGCLLHLPRFYVERKPKGILVIEEVIEILRRKPNGIASYDEVKSHFVDNLGFRKIWKTNEFSRIIKNDVKIKYKDLYPNSDQNLWVCKNGSDKIVRCFQLIDLNIDINEVWTKEEIEDDDEHGLLNNKNTPLDMPLMMYGLKIITDAGAPGITQNELSTKLGQNRLNARSICRNLVRKKCVAFFMDNIGRQRVTKFMSKHFVKQSAIQQVFSEHNILKSSKPCNENDQGVKRKAETEILQEESSAKRQYIGNESETSTIASESPSTSSLNTASTSNEELLISTTDSHQITTRIELTTKVPGIKFCNTGSNTEGRSWGGKSEGGATLTYRLLKRMNLLIKLINEHKVITDLTKLMKRINEDEEKEGDYTKIDKKTLYRLMLKVQEQGHIKLWKVTLSSEFKEKVMIFICAPSIQSPDDPIIQSEIERAKMKEFIGKYKEDKPTISVYSDNDFVFSKDQFEYMKSIYKRNASREHGYQPRFERTRLLHQLLYYLIYEQKDDDTVFTKDEAIAYWQSENPALMADQIYDELPEHIYSKQIGWKMFIPPLPNLRDWPKGWAMVCDVIFRLPIIIFVKLVCTPFELPELEEILRHPIKKYFLLNQVSSHLRSCLVYKRRFIFAVYQIFLQLCFIGLIQFGPQRFKEKDQQLIYLNKKAQMWDTRSSERGYNVISEQEYPVITMEFNNFEMVEKYWYELWNICVHTYLGMRINLSPGNEVIIIENAESKPILLDATEPRTTHEEAEQNDVGYIPGDKRGAGGLDSSLFSHGRRNWNWPSESHFKKVNTKVTTIANITKRKRLNYKDLSSKRTTNRKKVVQKVKKLTNIQTTVQTTTSIQSGRKLKRRIKITNISVHKRINRKPFYDDIDKEALTYMDKLRVDWSAEEDRVLLLCKVAFLFLSPKNKKHIIIFQHVRDCLHKLLNSKNKTSRACQRRINYVMKNPITQKSVALFLEELNQCSDIRNMFKNITKDKINIAFVVLLGILIKKFGCENGITNQISLPDSLEEFQTKYDYYSPNLIKTDMSYSHPQDIVEIESNVLQSTVHSAMSCAADKANWSFQLFKVYQAYPDALVRSVMMNMRRYQFISVKKSVTCVKRHFSKLPLSNVPFQLSQTYRNKLMTKHPFEIFTHSFNKICEYQDKLMNAGPKIEVIAMNGGDAACIFELTICHNINLKVQIPDHVIILDPKIKIQDDERYEKICKRFHDILHAVPLPVSDSMDVDVDNDDEELIVPDKIIENTSSDFHPNTSSSLKVNQTSRLAFHMTRHDVIDSIDDKTATQHIHDFFVVNSTNVFMDINENNKNDNLHPIDPEKCKQLLRNIQRFAVIPDEKPDLSIVTQAIFENNGNDEDIESCNKLVSFIFEQGCLGAPAKILVEKFLNLFNGVLTFYKILDILVDYRYIYKFGVVNINYIHYNHIRHWVIKSFKLKRSDKEKMIKNSSNDFIDELNNEPQHHLPAPSTSVIPENIDSQIIETENISLKKSNQKDEIESNNDKNTPAQIDKAKSIGDKKRLGQMNDADKVNALNQINKTEDNNDKTIRDEADSINQQKELENKDSIENASNKKRFDQIDKTENANNMEISNQVDEEENASDKKRSERIKITSSKPKKTNVNQYEEITVNIAPWIRIDGSINRRILDRWLGTVLCYCIDTPGVLVRRVCARFPFINPFQIRILLEYLEKLECIQLFKVIKSKVTLFDDELSSEIVSATGLENFDEVYVEALPTCVTKLGIFIGKKQYKTDFLSEELS